MVRGESIGGPLVSADRLAGLLDHPGLVVIDGSWYLPAAGRDPCQEYLTAHIPGAVRLPLEAVSDPGSDLPHMVPSPERFAAACEEIGVTPESLVVIYDGSGTNLSAARLWWLFRLFGHRNVAVLDGGFGAWASATRPVQRGENRRPRSSYPAPRPRPELVADLARIGSIVRGDGAVQLADCRPAGRFTGEVPEPRPGLRRGHIPGSRNIPFTEFTDPATGLMVPPARIRELLASRGLDPSRPIVASCGSGTSACVLALAVEVLRASGDASATPVAIYDGSWAEYGRPSGPPVERG